MWRSINYTLDLACFRVRPHFLLGFSGIESPPQQQQQRCGIFKSATNTSVKQEGKEKTGFSVPKKLIKWSYTMGQSSEPLKGATIGQLLEQSAAAKPDRKAFISVHQGVHLTIGQLLEQSDALAAGLLSLGIKRGDRVGIWAPNCIEWILVQYATARAGMILVNINPAYQSQELEFVLKKVGIKALVMSEQFKTQNYYELLARVCPEVEKSKGEIESKSLPDLKWVVMISEKQYAGTIKFTETMNLGNHDLLSFIKDEQNQLQFDDPINIQFTSGTTGHPKGATLTHHNIVNNGRFVGYRLNYDKKEARICLPVPMYHCFGMVMGSLQTVLHGSTCIFSSFSFDPESTLASIEKERCTSLYGTPTMFIDMLNLPTFAKYDLTSLHTGIMAGSPCPTEIMKKVISLMHMKEATICYGTTENSPVTFQSCPSDTLTRKVETVGRVQAHIEGKIVDEVGRIVPVGETGELFIRGYTVMKSYWEDLEQTTNAIGEDRWYRTGDLGVMDEEGYVEIVGRKKDMIIRGGENIYPVEIEQFLYTHPKIADVQVIGVPDERLVEQVAAWIRLKEKETATAQEIKDFCKGQIAHYKIPHYISFVTEFPLTITGKVQKFKMREMAINMYGLKCH